MFIKQYLQYIQHIAYFEIDWEECVHRLGRKKNRPKLQLEPISISQGLSANYWPVDWSVFHLSFISQYLHKLVMDHNLDWHVQAPFGELIQASRAKSMQYNMEF